MKAGTRVQLYLLPFYAFIIIVGLYLAIGNYRAFHIAVSLVSVIIAYTVFAVSVHTAPFAKNIFLLFLGTAYAFVGGLDFLHALVFSGIGYDYPHYLQNGLSLWISARLLEALSFMSAFLFFRVSYRKLAALVSFSAVTLFILVMIIGGFFPVLYQTEKGISVLKTALEWTVFIIFGAGLGLIYFNRKHFSQKLSIFLVVYICLSMAAEVFLAFQHMPGAPGTTAGMIFKVLSMIFLYQAMVRSTLSKPYETIFREQQEYNEILRNEIANRIKTEEELRVSRETLSELTESLEQMVMKEVAKNLENQRMIFLQSRQAAIGEMIGNIAHQWRQPLNNLGLIIQNIQQDYEFEELTAESVRQSVKQGMDQIEYMSQTIEDFRNFLKPEGEKSFFQILSAARRASRFIDASLKSNGIKLEFTGSEQAGSSGVQNAFAQVVVNLLANARDALLEHSTDNPCITVNATVEGAHSILGISDNAGGICDDIMPHLFEPYYTTKASGTGIGLYMSRLIIERYFHGRIEARNTDDGAEFRIILQREEP